MIVGYARTSNLRPTLDEARTAIDYVKRRRISRATKTWLASNPWTAPLTWRGDAVYIASWRWPRHEIAAFELDLGLSAIARASPCPNTGFHEPNGDFAAKRIGLLLQK